MANVGCRIYQRFHPLRPNSVCANYFYENLYERHTFSLHIGLGMRSLLPLDKRSDVRAVRY